jgi:hypothetical protein
MTNGIQYTVEQVSGGWRISTEVGFIPVLAHYRGSREDAVAEFVAPWHRKGST